MGYEHSTYYFDRLGQESEAKTADSVVAMTKTEHDTYGRASYSAKIIDIAGAEALLLVMKAAKRFKESSALELEIALRRQ